MTVPLICLPDSPTGLQTTMNVPHSPFTTAPPGYSSNICLATNSAVSLNWLSQIWQSLLHTGKIWTESPEHPPPHTPPTIGPSHCVTLSEQELQPIHNHHFQFPAVCQDWRETVETLQFTFPRLGNLCDKHMDALKPAWQINVYSTDSSCRVKALFQLMFLI